MRFILSEDLHVLVLAKVGGLGISIDEYLVGLIKDDLGKDDFSLPFVDDIDVKGHDVISSGDPICDEFIEI